MNATATTTPTYAVDIAKNVMQLHWIDLATGQIKRKKLPRAKFSDFFAQRQGARVAMEACGGAHHWARVLTALGHQVELLPARQVRAFVRGNKDDAADARAIWLAAQQSDIRRVPLKSCAQQAMLSLHRVRQHWVDVRTATVNALRGLLYEFGVALPLGKEAGLKALAERRALIEQSLPAAMSRLIDAQLLALKQIEQHVKVFEAELAAVQKCDDAAKRLRQVPGIGLLGATALSAVLGDAASWRNGREFSCCLGLTPRHSGTGGKVHMGGLSKRGDPYVRYLLINGSRSVLGGVNPPAWAAQMLQRRPFNVVVVALAHKLARTAWALVAHGRSYDGHWQSSAPRPRAQPAAL
jgi:transposase